MPILNEDDLCTILSSARWIRPSMTAILLSMTVKNLTPEPPRGRRVKMNTHHQPVLKEKQFRGKRVWEATKSGKGPASTAKPWEPMNGWHAISFKTQPQHPQRREIFKRKILYLRLTQNSVNFEFYRVLTLFEAKWKRLNMKNHQSCRWGGFFFL